MTLLFCELPALHGREDRAVLSPTAHGHHVSPAPEWSEGSARTLRLRDRRWNRLPHGSRHFAWPQRCSPRHPPARRTHRRPAMPGPHLRRAARPVPGSRLPVAAAARRARPRSRGLRSTSVGTPGTIADRRRRGAHRHLSRPGRGQPLRRHSPGHGLCRADLRRPRLRPEDNCRARRRLRAFRDDPAPRQQPVARVHRQRHLGAADLRHAEAAPDDLHLRAEAGQWPHRSRGRAFGRQPRLPDLAALLPVSSPT